MGKALRKRNPDYTTAYPPNVPAPLGWWDPSDSSNVTLIGSNVSQVDDLSGNGYHMTQATDSNRPTIASAQMNGLDALSFDGTEYIQSTIGTEFSGTDIPFTLSFVYQFDNADLSGTEIILSFGHSTTASNHHWFGGIVSDVLRTRRNGTGTAAEVDFLKTDASPHVVSLVFDGNDIDVWYDGVLVKQATLDLGDVSLNNLTLGAWDSNGEGFNLDGKIGEVWVHDTVLNYTALKSLHMYLGMKWVNLPSGADLFGGWGQSNMRGQGDSATATVPAPHTSFMWNATDNVWQLTRDPVGTANTGSLLPAFGNQWRTSSNRIALVGNFGIGGTAMQAEADSGNGDFEKASAEAYTTHLNSFNDIADNLSATTFYVINSQNVLWLQGERDAQALAASDPGVSAANYTTELKAMVDDLDADLTNGLDNFYIIEVGARNGGTQESSFAAIRAAQQTAADEHSKIFMTTKLPKTLAGVQMQDDLHFNQTGYNLIGADAAKFTFYSTGDNTPDSIDFTDVTGVTTPLSVESSNIILPLNYQRAIVRISGQGSPQYRICADGSCSVVNHDWSSDDGFIDRGEYIQVRLTGSDSDDTTLTADLELGTLDINFAVTTGTINDDIPAAFDFTDVLDATASTLTSSDIVQITSIGSAVDISVSGGGSPQYRICADGACSTVNHDWTASAGSIDNNEYVQLRLTSSATEDATNTATLTVGQGSADWAVTTNEVADLSSYTGYIAHYDASDSANYTLVSGNVSQWDDLSGNGYHLAQSTAGNRPDIASAAINGLDCINFTLATGEYLDNTDTGLASAIDGTDVAFSVHLVYQSDQTASDNTMFSFQDTNPANSGFRIDHQSINGTRVRIRDNAASSVNVGFDTPDTLAHVMSVVVHGTEVSVWLDGTQVEDNTSFNVGAKDVVRLRVGAQIGGSTLYFDGKIGEIVVYSAAHSDADAVEIHTYLRDKWEA